MKKDNKLKDSLADKIITLVVVYTIGVLLAVLLNLLRVLGGIRILNGKRFPRYRDNPELYKNGLLLISNHPSLLEPILLPSLFWKDYLFHPLKLSPWSTPDKSNYYDRWYWFWLRPRAIPINRDSNREGSKAFFQMKKILNSGGILILFPEGGRTERGRRFLYSEKGKKIRTLKEGIGSLVLATDASVFYTWVDGADKVMPVLPNKFHVFPRFWKGEITVKIGKTVKLEKTSREEIIQQVAIDLLELADKEE